MRARLRQLASRFIALFRAPSLDHDFEEELESHIAMLSEDNVRRGMTPQEAHRAAVLRTGPPAALKEEHRDERGVPTLDSLWQDLRFAFRLIARDKWSSAAAILTLALGIGANAVGFTIVNTAFFRGLPFEESGRLHILSWNSGPDRNTELSQAEFDTLRTQNRSFDLAAFTESTMNISDDRALPQRVTATRLTPNAFRVLRQKPLRGRDFVLDDARPSNEDAVIIGYDVWNDRYSADPGAVGRRLRVNGRPATIVGVMPQGMKFPESSQLWMPLVPEETAQGRAERELSVLARLRDDVAIEPATAELNAIGGRLKAMDPENTKNFLSLDAQTLVEAFVGGTSRPFFSMVIIAVFFVLLIACANVANLLLSRSASRAREMALRLSIGATRKRLVRQLLMESVVLGLSGGVLGLVIASLGVPAFESAMQASLKPYWMVFSLDYSVVAYIGMICLVVALLAGLAPALHISKTNGLDVLKEGGRGVTGSRRVRWFSEGIVVAQLSLTVVLLAGAGFMMRSFVSLYSADIGVDTRLLVSMQIELPLEKYAAADARRAFFKRLSDQSSAVAGIDAAAVTTGVPPLDGGERLLELEREASQSDAGPRWASIVAIGPGFFTVLDRPVRRGRNFQETDGEPGVETVIINERLADLFFPGQDPLGRRLRFASRSPAKGALEDPWRTVVGVSAPVRHGSPQDEYLGPVAYVPYHQDAPRSASLLVRSALPLSTISAATRTAVQAIDPDQPISTVQTVQQMMDADRWPFRIFGTLFGLLAATALSLSAVGLYGVIACSVAQRTQEIGVRMAVGAQRSQVSWLILRGGLKQLAFGLPLGLIGAVALGIALRRILVAGAQVDVVTLGAITVLLIAVSVCACLLPAWRATRVDPVVALRAD